MPIQHPPLQPGWIDRPHEVLPLGDFVLESGQTIREFGLSYVMHGAPDARRSNVVLALCAIGSTHHRLDAWIGPGRALDTERLCVVCVDAIGNGLTSSPSTSVAQHGLRFPRFTLRDMVESQRRLIEEHLGVARLHAVVGASMGGMQALQWAVSHPAAMRKVVALVPMAKTTPWSVAVNEASRSALMADPAWPDSEPGAGWRTWTALMRVLAGRTPAALASAAPGREAVLQYLETQTAVREHTGFKAIDWVYQTWAYDAHDVGTTAGFGGDTGAALESIRAKVLLMAPPLDLYNPSAAAHDAAAKIGGARVVEIPTADGHQCASGADSTDTAFIDRTMGEFLAPLDEADP